MVAKRLPRGFRGCGIVCGVKRSGKEDLALLVSDEPAAAAAVMTRNRFKGAPLHVTRKHLRGGRARAIVANSGIANVATGERGLRDAEEMTRTTAECLGLRERDVLVASTGLIGAFLPMDRIAAGIGNAAGGLARQGGEGVARGIMTTDTVPKAAGRRVSVSGKNVELWGCAKGAGMIHPDMATMLSFILTDAAIEPKALRSILRPVVDRTFNRITVDGDMSTSDMVVILANGVAGNRPIETPKSRAGKEFASALEDLCGRLCEMLVRDGEGATRLIRVEVEGAPDEAEAERIARGVATGNLVKTAIAGGDPNWGRIVARVGQFSRRANLNRMKVYLGRVLVFADGTAMNFPLRKAEKAVQGKDVLIRIVLDDGKSGATAVTCDLTYEYIRINAEYHT
jgi:glutamate N-acetyltransferase/amino-acid N-acetyltransferase